MLRNMARPFATVVFLIVVFGFGQTAIAQTCTPAPVGLTSWWPGDGNALDSRSRINGTLVGNAGFAAGKVGQAFNLDGVDDYVQVPHNSNQNIQGSFSAEVWIFPRSLPNAGPRILDKDNQAGDRWLMGINNTASFVNSLTVAIGTTAITTPDNSIPIGQWTHVAFTYNSVTGDFLAFINGIQAASLNIASLTSSNIAPLIIGDDSFPNPPGDPNAREFDGLIDEPAIYNRALSSGELLAIVNAGTAGKCKPTATIAPSGQVGWWPGDGNPNDIAGANNGTLQGGAGFAVSKVGQGFNFNGASQFVEIPDSPGVSVTGAISVEAWIRPTAQNLEHQILSKYDSIADQRSFYFGIKPDNKLRFVVYQTETPSTIFRAVDSNAAIPLNVWTHVVGTFDPATQTMKIYLDGVDAPISTIGGSQNVASLADDTAPLRIGAVSNSSAGILPFNGQIDEASLYNRALTQDEVTSIFNAGIAGKLKTSTTAVGTNVSTNAGSDATITFPNVSAAGTTQQIPLDTAVLPALPGGFTQTGLAYDISTAASVSGSIDIRFHLPSFNDPMQFALLKVLHNEGGAFFDRTVVKNFSARTLTATVSSLSAFVIANGTSPTAVTLASFTATGFDDGRVLVKWQTGFEADNLGFNIYREESGKRTLINPSLVAGSALLTGIRTVLSAGQSYVWADNGIANCGSRIGDCKNARYWLEDVDLNGKSTLHGPIEVRYSRGKSPSFAESELLARIGWRQGLATNGLGPTPVQRAAGMPRLSAELLDSQTDLAAKPAVKLSIKREGWYRVTQPELIRAGLAASVDPRFLSMFVDGQQIPIKVTGETDGRFDPSDAVEFYGLGLDTPVTSARVYWLVTAGQPGLRTRLVDGGAGVPPPGSFALTVERKDRTVYFSSLRNGDDENFFGPVVATQPVDQSLHLQHLDLSSGNAAAAVEVALQGVTLLAHTVRIEVNGASIGTIKFYGQSAGRLRLLLPQSLLREGENTVRLTAQAGPGDISLLNFVRITYQHSYQADSNLLRFTTSGKQRVTIGGFTSGEIRIFDVTDPLAVLELRGIVTQQKSGFGVTVEIPETGERHLLALTADQIRSPERMSLNQPSSWHQAANTADLVIITRRDFFSSVEPLSALRQSQGLKVAVVDAEDIYDEFSFGQKSPHAVRNFLAFANSNWKKKPRFVLFAGHASYDPKDYLGLGDSDFVPTKLIDTDYMETASDDWFVDFDSDGFAEMSTGRLPARTADEAARMIRKVFAYESSSPSQEMLLVADESDGYDFEADNNQLASIVPTNIAATQVSRGRVDTETAKKNLLDGIHRGQKLVNYTGHGSVNQWRGNLLTSDDALVLRNDRLPIFVMMTCLNGYFHDPALDSLAESLLKADHGGAVAVWASSGITLPGDQGLMNQELYRQLFNSPRAITLGEAMMRAKSSIADSDVRRTWVLIGDPTMKVK